MVSKCTPLSLASCPMVSVGIVYILEPVVDYGSRLFSDVGQPILAAAAFQAASLLVREVSPLQPPDPFRWSSAEPPRKAAAARIGCPTWQSRALRTQACLWYVVGRETFPTAISP